MALPGQSPVPPADGIVTDERLSALLALGAEYDELDFKRVVDLSTRQRRQKDAVELAKDVGAMQVKGGYIVIGVDGQGKPTGQMDDVDTTAFDPANLVPKMERYLQGPLTIATNVPTRGGHKIVLVCVTANPNGCAFFRIDGTYTRANGSTETAFREHDVFWRTNTRSVRIDAAGLEEIIERRFAARREDLLREWAAAQQALSRGGTGGAPPRVNFSLVSEDVSAAARELLRQNDEVGLRQLIIDGRNQTIAAIEADDEDQLPLLLDSLICLAAVLLTYEAEDWFDRTVQALVDAYASVADADEVKLLGHNARLAPTARAPRLWLAIIERVYALGGLAVRLEAWKAIRTLTDQLPRPLAEAGYERNWLRHALTMASRAARFVRTTENDQREEIGLIDLARDDGARLTCLRSDRVRADDEALLTSIARFDVLANVAAIDAAHSTDPRVFYTNFARFYQDRIQPAVNRLLSDAQMREEIFRGTDAELATALATIGYLASQEGMRYRGFQSWASTPAGQFIAENLPPEDER